MPKIKVFNAKKIQSIIKDFKEFRVTAKDELYYPLWCCIVKHKKRFFVEQHVATLKHRKVIQKTNSAGTLHTQQTFISAGTSDTKQTFISAGKLQDFATKLVHSFESCDIPLAKLNHLAIQKLFRDLGQSVPSGTRCHLKVKKLCETNDRTLAKDLSEKPLFFVIDKTELKEVKTFRTYSVIRWINRTAVFCLNAV